MCLPTRAHLAELSAQPTVPLALIGVPVVFGLVGSLFVVLGLRSSGALRRFRRTAERAPGVVLDLVLDRSYVISVVCSCADVGVRCLGCRR